MLDLQRPDGHWVGELQGDTILESEYILLHGLPRPRGRGPGCAKAAHYILAQQRPDGGWSNYPGGPVELSVSVKAYFALKLAGHDPARAVHAAGPRGHPRRWAARRSATASRSSTWRSWASSPTKTAPSVPPEMMLLPRWCYFNLYAMSSWTRTIVVPLSIFSAYKPVRQLARRHRASPNSSWSRRETPRWPHPPTRRWFTWTNFFLGRRLAVQEGSSAGAC